MRGDAQITNVARDFITSSFLMSGFPRWDIAWPHMVGASCPLRYADCDNIRLRQKNETVAAFIRLRQAVNSATSRLPDT